MYNKSEKQFNNTYIFKMFVEKTLEEIYSQYSKIFFVLINKLQLKIKNIIIGYIQI